MATRALKKLTKKDDLKEIQQKFSQIEPADKSEEENESEEESFKPVNKFNLLDEDMDEPVVDQDSEPEAHIESKSKNKKKKKKGKSKPDTEFKFVSTDINEENEASSQGGAESGVNDAKIASHSFRNEAVRRLFHIESKNLNPDTEMTRMFGARVVQTERQASSITNPRFAKRFAFRSNSIVNVKNSWPLFRRNGLSMRILKEEPETNSIEFAFEHDESYRKVQFNFMDAIEAMNDNFLSVLLAQNPYHIDCLIQISEIFRIHDNTQSAADVIERALYAFQSSFHPSFNFTLRSSTNNLKLDYHRVENRGFFIALFKHIVYVGEKSCYRTALELCKLLLSLSIDSDPLGVVLFMDFYAIRSSQYEYLIEFYETFNPIKHLNLMPNMLMSVALAHFYLHTQNKSKREYHLTKGTELLKECLIKFPALLMELLDKCGVMPDTVVEKHWIFARVSHLSVPVGLKYLIALYVNRMYHEWKIAENLQWLENTVKQVISEEKKHTQTIKENQKKFGALFAKAPSNLYRHLILSNIKEVTFSLPSDYPPTATYNFDPVPPRNSIISYTRPPRPANNAGTPLTASEHILSFFRSMVPGFNPNPVNRPGGPAALDPEEEEEAVAAAAVAEAAQGQAFNTRQLMNALAQLLANTNEPNAADDEDQDIEEFD